VHQNNYLLENCFYFLFIWHCELRYYYINDPVRQTNNQDVNNLIPICISFLLNDNIYSRYFQCVLNHYHTNCLYIDTTIELQLFTFLKPLSRLTERYSMYFEHLLVFTSRQRLKIKNKLIPFFTAVNQYCI